MSGDMEFDVDHKNDVQSVNSLTVHGFVDNCGVSSFVAKLWAMLCDDAAHPYIKWADSSGERIIILDHVVFSTRILSKFE